MQVCELLPAKPVTPALCLEIVADTPFCVNVFGFGRILFYFFTETPDMDIDRAGGVILLLAPPDQADEVGTLHWLRGALIKLLEDLHVDYQQGFYFSRPVTKEHFVKDILGEEDA